MSKTNKKRKNLPLPAKLLIALISVCAVCCLAVSGYYGYLLLNRGNMHYSKGSRSVTPEGEAKMYDAKSTILKQTADAGREYIDETLFLGDSNTVRFMQFFDSDGTSFTSDQNTIAVVGMGAEGITSVPCEQLDYGTYTMTAAVELLQPRRIIMTFGTNNLDALNMNAELFIENYEPQVQAVADAYPYADLIINSIPPCGEISNYPLITVEQIREFNDAILRMCEKNEWKFLNSFEALADPETGYGKPEYIEYDGIHLTADGLSALFRYIRTHAWIKEDERPKPLDPLPYIIGPITEIYAVDPLSNLPFDDSVLHPEAEQAAPVYEPEEPQAPAEEPVPEEPIIEEPVIEEPVGQDGNSDNPIQE